MIKKVIWQCRRGVDIKAAKQGRWEPVGDVEGALKAGAGSSVNVYGSEMKRVADQRGWNRGGKLVPVTRVFVLQGFFCRRERT
ncbi:hypothetical protein HMPREF3033_00635 [Veillonellaceae bacterium DNF00751]|nr:hypothetical protein HMPREF3033_00635 [Veillonellaceae bacterium DNF00751]